MNLCTWYVCTLPRANRYTSAVTLCITAAIGAIEVTRPSQAYPDSGSARRTVLSCTATMPEQTKLDPAILGSTAASSAEEIDHFQDFAYPANKARWKKNTKQVSTTRVLMRTTGSMTIHTMGQRF